MYIAPIFLWSVVVSHSYSHARRLWYVMARGIGVTVVVAMLLLLSHVESADHVRVEAAEELVVAGGQGRRLVDGRAAAIGVWLGRPSRCLRVCRSIAKSCGIDGSALVRLTDHGVSAGTDSSARVEALDDADRGHVDRRDGAGWRRARGAAAASRWVLLLEHPGVELGRLIAWTLKCMSAWPKPQNSAHWPAKVPACLMRTSNSLTRPGHDVLLVEELGDVEGVDDVLSASAAGCGPSGRRAGP